MKERESVASQVLKIRRDTLPWESAERHKAHPWPIFGSDLWDYGQVFKTVPNFESLETLAKEIRRQRENAWVLDVFADETVVEELVLTADYSGGLAMTLASKPKYEDDQNIGLVAGNVLSNKTWRNASSWMQKRGIEGFDLILSRGEGALSRIPDDPDIHFFLLQNLWSRLSPQGGVMLLQVPGSAAAALKRWMPVARDAHIEVNGDFDQSARFPLMVRRSPDSPTQLPKIQLPHSSEVGLLEGSVV